MCKKEYDSVKGIFPVSKTGKMTRKRRKIIGFRSAKKYRSLKFVPMGIYRKDPGILLQRKAFFLRQAINAVL